MIAGNRDPLMKRAPSAKSRRRGFVLCGSPQKTAEFTERKL
jgi:hypothetical protein